MVNDLFDQFDRFTIQNILRTKNRYVDAMASATSLTLIEIEIIEKSLHQEMTSSILRHESKCDRFLSIKYNRMARFMVE